MRGDVPARGERDDDCNNDHGEDAAVDLTAVARVSSAAKLANDVNSDPAIGLLGEAAAVASVDIGKVAGWPKAFILGGAASINGGRQESDKREKEGGELHHDFLRVLLGVDAIHALMRSLAHPSRLESILYSH